MMPFTVQEILRSLIYAAVFGIGFFLFFTVAAIIVNQIRRLRFLPSLIIKYDKISEKTIKNNGRIENKSNSVSVSAAVVLFILGFLLLSYYALDGIIRIYLFLVSFISFAAAKQLFYKHIYSIINTIFDVAYHLFVLALRILCLPFLRIYLYIYSKYIIKILYKTRATLDKSKIKC